MEGAPKTAIKVKRENHSGHCLGSKEKVFIDDAHLTVTRGHTSGPIKNILPS